LCTLEDLRAEKCDEIMDIRVFNHQGLELRGHLDDPTWLDDKLKGIIGNSYLTFEELRRAALHERPWSYPEKNIRGLYQYLGNYEQKGFPFGARNIKHAISFFGREIMNDTVREARAAKEIQFLRSHFNDSDSAVRMRALTLSSYLLGGLPKKTRVTVAKELIGVFESLPSAFLKKDRWNLIIPARAIASILSYLPHQERSKAFAILARRARDGGKQVREDIVDALKSNCNIPYIRNM